MTFRPVQKLTISADAEGASSGGVYFRTSLYDYQKVRAHARYQVTGSFSLAADFNLLNNQNPLPGVKYDYFAHQEALSLLWAPSGGKNWSLQGSYDRSTLRSDISYLDLPFYEPQQSLYRDNAHTATALFTTKLWRYKGLTSKLSAGGSFCVIWQPPHQLLSAARQTVRSARQEIELVRRVELLRIRRSVLSVRRVSDASRYHGLEVFPMIRLLLLFASLSAAQAASLGATPRGVRSFSRAFPASNATA